MMKSEICIVGGGLVGLTAALAFSSQGRRVSLLEAHDFQLVTPAQMDARSIALSWSSVQILSALDLWPGLRDKTAPIHHIHVSSAGHFGVTRLHAQDLQQDAMGHVIEYHVLMQYLLEAVKNNAAIEMLTPARLLSLKQGDNKVSIHYRQGDTEQELETDLLVVADGANSKIREMLAIAAITEDYEQTAIIANVKITLPFNGYAYERFTSDGPLALLPLPDQRYAMVWTNAADRAEQLMQLPDAQFLHEIYRIFGYRLGYFSGVGSRVKFDLKRTRSSRLTANCSVLIGNAANTLHPVAGQGFNLALRDVALLYDELAGEFPGSSGLPRVLEAYAAKREQDQQRTVQLGDGLVKLFSNDLPLINHARAGALALLDVCPLLKQEVSWQGMGYGSGFSSLMRGVRQ